MAQTIITQQHDGETSDGKFIICVSRDREDDKEWFAGVVWFKRTGSWAAEESRVSLETRHEIFVGISEELVFQEACDWVTINLGANAKIIQKIPHN